MFYAVLYQPLFNLLIWLYNIIPGMDLGFAIIAISLVTKLVLWPFSHVALKSQKSLQEIQPKLEALKEQFKDDKEGLTKAMMQLYQTEKVNPLSSCLPLLIQLPILFALYAVLRDGLRVDSLVHLYPFIHNPGSINPFFLNWIDLGQPHLVMAIVAGILQFVQTKMLMTQRPPRAIRKKEGAKDEDMLTAMNQSMTYMMPIMTVVIGASLPGGLTLYWIVMNIFSIVQQFFVLKSHKKSEISSPVISQ
ncbi:MAG: Membrane protein insertase, YidC/Oxa1 family [Candidatus Uhrbacteria bacterium GW2011_GWF2_41_16]|uniref:Membrane protein insertase, YidC/Oxa1 family n=2 Tax=Candidatus Uhriibacteriota TaxID=1752732 RepID=A0A0G0XMZ4_9BACT|nr:MAG: Membrane protein insertase, YidC/Oxa1 family [Candidatus Uhrbacteria bacterium GW2011_GWC2_41_11]KKR98160.1 MAG: Membrane protein insertase, YidC/Oxa1 family [Candidatus Uhrbacteria bacterium GW2011_GWF2_41_16]HBO99873.1 hypothetical protein [Candidatus Uhrbacteria bacterium]